MPLLLKFLGGAGPLNAQGLGPTKTMFVHLYVRRGTVYVPTLGETESGLYVDIEPVEAAASTDPDGIAEVLARE